MNTLFFSSCFIASLLLEGYAVQVLDGDILTTAGLGIVVLITGYLLVDSVRSGLKRTREESKLYIEQRIMEESNKWDEKYSQLIHLQKATYTSTKKNKDILNKQFEDLLIKIETFENINTSAQQKIMELQKMVMEGQKKALNLEVKYNKENTNQILKGLHTELSNSSTTDQIAEILFKLENNTQLFKDGIDRILEMENHFILVQQQIAEGFKSMIEAENDKNLADNDRDNKVKDSAEDDSYNVGINIDQSLLDSIYNSFNQYENTEQEDMFSQEASISQEINYDHTTDQEALGNQEISINQELDTGFDKNVDQQSEIDYNIDTNLDNDFNVAKDAVTYENNEVLSNLEIVQDEKTSVADISFDEEPASEALITMIEDETEKPKVVPLYDDPNKALSADEIAALFASFGQ